MDVLSSFVHDDVKSGLFSLKREMFYLFYFSSYNCDLVCKVYESLIPLLLLGTNRQKRDHSLLSYRENVSLNSYTK